MPDWSYHTLFRPILHRLPPRASREFIHRSMNTLSSVPGGGKVIDFLGHLNPSSTHTKTLFNVEFQSSIGLCGKIDPELTGLQAFQNLGFGFIEIGPVSTEEAPIQTIQLQNEQVQVSNKHSIHVNTVLKQLHLLKKKKLPFLFNLAGSSIEELTDLIRKLHAYADIVSIPHDSIKSKKDMKTLRDCLKHTAILLTISANDVKNERTIEQLLSFDPDGIMLDESTHSPSTEEHHQNLVHAIKLIRGQEESLPIVTVGGIKEPNDGLSLSHAGVALSLLSYEYVFSGPGLPKRINELLAPKNTTIIQGWIWYWLFGLSIMIGGFIALLFSMTWIILPYDESFLGINRFAILSYNPLLLNFMAHDRMTLAGTMISGGVIYMQLAKHGVQFGLHWARKSINIGGITGFFGILLFIGYGYFDWLHALFWIILLPLFIRGFVTTKGAIHSPRSVNRYNHRNWKRSLIGQLMFIILGFSLLIGGVVISFLGTTSVFVPTDLLYICLSPEMMNEFNNRLIPLIAHDRAGFGSALLSVGLLVLTLSLWGFREGDRFVWWTLTLGAIPAFLSGIATHFVIGYTTFIHLLPAYFALLLYVVGVILSAPYLLKKYS
ncbi:dihydroorotate dehydrogenase [Bacillus sp. BGMRC 2118]|nr:dihydroorotate dehydrogenase [Bacillus sp. BGMRC 2118]